MQLISLSVEHYRSLYETGWVSFHDMTVLIGENDAGKTTTLDALEVLLGNRQPDDEDFSFVPTDRAGNHDQRETDIRIEGKFSLTDPERDQIPMDIPLQDGYLHICKEISTGGSSHLNVVGQVPADSRLRIDLSSTTINGLRELATKLNLQIGGVSKQPFIEAIRQYTAAQPTTDGSKPLPALLRTMLPEFTRFDSASDPKSVVHGVLRTVFRQELEKPENIKPLKEVETNITNVLRQRAAELDPFVQKYRPDIKSISVDPEFNFESGFRSTEIRFHDQNDREILLERRGTGFRKHITLAVYEWNSEVLKKRQEQGARPLILALDEPDTSLDYQSQRKMFDTIQGFVSPLVQVVICTHSINLINWVPIEKLNHYALVADSSKSSVESFAPDASDPDEVDFFLHRLGDSLGLNHALMFHERCFLLVEGKTEETALPIIFRFCTGEYPYTKGVRIVNSYDNYGVIVFAKFLHKHGRRVVFAVDQDTTWTKGVGRLLTTSKLMAANFDVDTQVHIIGPDCFENSFSDEVWARALQAATGSFDWTPEKVGLLRQPPQQFVTNLLKESNILDKATLGLELAKSLVDSGDVPECLRNCIERAVKLAE